jgi:CheY-like chemotaxis protein
MARIVIVEDEPEIQEMLSFAFAGTAGGRRVGFI